MLRNAEHVTGKHGFLNYGHLYYRLRPAYDSYARKRSGGLSWFGGSSRPASRPEEVLQRHAALSTSPATAQPSNVSKITVEKDQHGKQLPRKITMSQSCIIDLDPSKKSDRAEMAWLHADIIHNCRNA